MRLFFALWPDANTRERLADAAHAVRLGPATRLVAQENYHLTLVFIGEVADSQRALLQAIGRSHGVRRCRIEFDAYEYWREPKVLVAAARNSPAALVDQGKRLRSDLAANRLGELALQAPAPLRPHVTLARKVAQAPVLQAMTPFSWTPLHLSLVRSDTGGLQSVYTVVDTWPLLDEAPDS